MESLDLTSQELQINNLLETTPKTIFGTLKADYIIAKSGSTIFGRDSADVLDALKDKASNKIYGEQGNDILLGASKDNLFGGEGNDQLLVNSGDAKLSALLIYGMVALNRGSFLYLKKYISNTTDNFNMRADFE